MKTLRHFLGLLACMIWVQPIPSVYAQEGPELGFFQAFEHEGRVIIRFEILAGNICEGIQINRSVENFPFVQIGEIPGICGSKTEAVVYHFIDDYPVKNQLNNYQLTLGRTVGSEILGVELISFENKNFQIRLDFNLKKAKIWLDNPAYSKHVIDFYSISGRKIQAFETRDKMVEFRFDSFPAGSGFFRIQNLETGSISTGRFFVP